MEDSRRVSNGEQVSRIAKLALGKKPSVDFGGYWQRHIKRAAWSVAFPLTAQFYTGDDNRAGCRDRHRDRKREQNHSQEFPSRHDARPRPLARPHPDPWGSSVRSAIKF
jgi:hypothetical protein